MVERYVEKLDFPSVGRVLLLSKIVVLLWLPSPVVSWAHGGGTDSNGCHRETLTNTRHCHEANPNLDKKNREFKGEPRLIDGDTFDLDGVRIRLFGVDAPESAETCDYKGATILCGQSALFALADRLKDSPVTCQNHGTDRYGRVVAKCFESGEDIGAWMVRQGWARAFTRYSQEYNVEEQAARKARRGIWANQEW